MTWNWFHYKLLHLPKSQYTKTTTASIIILYSFIHWIIKKSSNLETSTYQWWCTQENLSVLQLVGSYASWNGWMFPIFIWTNPKLELSFSYGTCLVLCAFLFVRRKLEVGLSQAQMGPLSIFFLFSWINFLYISFLY